MVDVDLYCDIYLLISAKWHLSLSGSSLDSLISFHEIISIVMAFKLHFALMFNVYFVYISEIFVNVNLTASIQRSGIFTIQFVTITFWLLP